jgi:hypothetical protein
LAWDTLFPTMGFLPVTSQTRAIRTLRSFHPAKQPVPGDRLSTAHPARPPGLTSPKGGGNPFFPGGLRKENPAL